MSYKFLPYNIEQMFLMPPSISDWVAEGSLARFVSDVIEYFDASGKLAPFYSGYRDDGWGCAAYHPRMMVKVIVYAYTVGVTGSRRIARALENDVSLRFLSANQQPDFRTISDFRKNNLEAFQSLFAEVLELCREAGLAKMGRVALDGCKVAGNASLSANRTKEGIEKEVERMLSEAEKVDEEEDAKYGRDKRGDELPKGLRTKADRMKRLKEAHERLKEREDKEREEQEEKIKARKKEEIESGKKKRGRKPKEPKASVNKKAKANITDPESRILKTRNGYKQGYNGQAAADCKTQVIVACDVTQEENDVNQLKPMLDKCEEQAGERPKELLADAGYWSETNVELEDENTELFIATKKDWKQRKELMEKGAPRGPIPKNATARDKMERKLLTKRGKETYKKRSPTIEPVFGQMNNRGLTNFMLRGLKKVKTEWSLWCATHNLLKLWRSGYAFDCAM